MRLLYADDSVTVRYAAEEFTRLYRAVDGRQTVETVRVGHFPAVPGKEEIFLGTLDELGRARDDVQDELLDDVLDISVENLSGILAGSNRRSILMAVYRYFHYAGCRFLRPGTDGEALPKRDLSAFSCTYRKKADSRIRGECIEGAVSYENVRDTILWMPKVMLNAYHMEGIIPYVYFHKWYAHIGNEYRHIPGYITKYTMLEKIVAALEQDIVRTGMLFINLGHGWMFRKLGVKEGSVEQETAALRDEDRKYLAMVNGKRELFVGHSFNTNFCYNNPEGRALLVQTLVEYLHDKPYVDILKVGFADGRNNWCECPACQNSTPSDDWVQLLNDIDETFTRLGIHTRISFGMYVETIRPPQVNRLRHPERFIISTAFGWNYEPPYYREPFTGVIPPYVRNRYKSFTVAERTECFRRWMALNPGMTAYDYEYRFYIDMYADMGYTQIAHELYRDMTDLPNVGYSGTVDDQTHRCHVPTSLPMLVRAEALFDRSMDEEAFTADYYEKAFGENGALVREYLTKLTKAFRPDLIRRFYNLSMTDACLKTPMSVPDELKLFGNPQHRATYEQVVRLIDEFFPHIEEGEQLFDDVTARAWEYLRYHAEICRKLAGVLALCTDGEREKAQGAFLELEKYLFAVEPDIQEGFDCYLFDRYYRKMLGLPAFRYYDTPKNTREAEA